VVEVPPLEGLAGWADVLPVVALAAVVLVLPGALLGRVAGARGLVLWAAAPALTTSLLALGAVVLQPLGVRFGPVSATAVLALALVVVASARRASRRTAAATDGVPAGRPPRPASRRDAAAAVAGVVLGAAAVSLTLVAAVRSPALVPQRYDAVFHLNGVRHVLDTGDGSTLTLGLLTSTTRGFYPAAWHDLVATVAGAAAMLPTGPGTGSSWDLVVVATNVTALVVAAVAWPAGVVLLAREVAPRARLGTVAAGASSGAFPLFPSLLLNWGVVYPTFLAVALLPAAVVVGLRAAGGGAAPGLLPASRPSSPADAPRPPGRGAATVLLLVGVVPGLALAHPTGAAALGVLLLPTLGASLVAGGRRLASTRRGRPAAVAALLLVGAASAVLAVALPGSAVLASMSAVTWPAGATAPQAVGEALLGAPPEGRGAATWWASLAAVGGAVVLVRRRRARLLLLGTGLAGALFVVARSTDTSPLTALWYSDPVRIAPLVTVVAAPLAGIGLGAAAVRAVAAVPRRARPALALVLVLPAAAAMTVAPGSGGTPTRESLRLAYSSDADDVPLLDGDEVSLLAALPDLVPEEAVIAADPHDGGALAYALADREVLFTHLSGSWDEDSEVVGRHLDRLGSDPRVCAALTSLGVGYVLDLGGPSYYAGPRTDELYRGLRAASPATGLSPVAASGESLLLQVTGCPPG